MNKAEFLQDLARAMAALKESESIRVRMKRHDILLALLDEYMQYPDWELSVASEVLNALSESHDIMHAYLDERGL